MCLLIRPSSTETVKIRKTTVKAGRTDYVDKGGVSDGSWSWNISHTLELTIELEFHAVHVSILCNVVVFYQMV